jgi:uncharacterized protein (DUF1330 family)
MNTTYNFLSVGGSAKQTISFGFKTRTIGPKFLFTCKFRVNDTKAEFIGKYLVGRLPDFLVASDRVQNRKGHWATTFMMVTEDVYQKAVLWEALKYAEAYDLRKQADEAEFLAHNFKWELEALKQDKYQVQFEPDTTDDLPF